ncbi:E3 ubiquitin-protein ligase lubel [Ixodes scapularis]|uniref:E3 ubiquitin-protein ligase lubel n=1 Tax=Ixodes scapularis TaxID=6945 RepID=UPI001C38CBDD|nr:E3 ubiquitin-protein ligase lubel [Ixodes scapularis]
MRTQGLELVRLIREAEQRGFTADDLQVAMNHCGNDNPINWLRDNWRHMTETVVTLATNYGHDRRDNTIGIVSVSEAQNALRRQKGNIWAAVTECVENRQRMFMELSSRGTFSREEILTALTDNHGNMDMAYAQLTKATLKPFLMRIWGPGTGVDNDEGAQPTLPSPLDSKSDDSVTKRVKDWLESLDASQVPAYRLEAGDGRTQNRHSFHGTRTKDIVGERGRSSSPASSFSSQRETSDVSSVSSMTRTTSSRLEAILQRREAQKVYERGRKSKKEVHTDRKRRWTLASVFDGKKIASVVKKDTFDNAESKCQTSTSVATLASDTTPLDSSSSGATKSSETLASVEATGAKPKTFLGRLSSFRKDSNKKEVSTFEPHAIESSSSAMNGTGSNTTVSTETVKEAAVTGQPAEVQNISPTAAPSAARKEGFLSKLLNAKQKSNERERINEGLSITPGLSQTAGTPTLKEASETADDSHNRNSIENIKQSIHAAKISFMTSPPVPVVQPEPQKPSISAAEATQSKAFVHNSNNGSSLERHFNPAPASDIPKTPKVGHNSPKLQNARGAQSPRSTNLEKVKATSSIKPQLNKSETRTQDTPAKTLIPQEKQGALKARIASTSLNKSSIREPNQGETNTNKSKGSTKGPEADGGSSEVVTVPRTQSSPDSQQTRQLVDKENVVSTAPFTPDASTTTSQKADSPSSSVQALMATQNDDAATTGPPIVVLDRSLSPKEREVEGSAKIDAQEPRNSYDALTQSSSSADKVEVVVSEAETPDGIVPQTTSQQEGQVTRRSRPSRQQDDEATNTTVPRRQGRRLSDTTAPRRRERPQPEGTPSTETSRSDSLNVEPSTATGKGLYRRPSLRRPSRSGENGEDSAVRGPDGSVIIVKPQKPMERRSSVNARPGLHISRAVAANIAKLRSVPPPKKRKQVVQPRPAGKLPTEKQTQYKVKAEELVQDGKCPSMVHAQLVAELIDMSFDEEDAIVAAEQCDSIYQAVNFLQQECELCAANYPISQMVSLLNCVHRACNECLRAYFTIQIRDRNIAELLCPFCNEPDLGDEDVELNYFNNLDVLLKNLVEQDVYDLFQQKLRDRALMKDPNFRWCSQCSSGFITYPDQKRLVCPDCRAVTCAFCRKPWQKQHEGISCEQFQEWQEDNDPESQAEGIARYLSDNGIDCPNCKFKYALARGGCMHFKCYQCGFDFCCGCNQPFKMGEKCGWSPICAKLGLHAHHPRNCLFYLRDKDINELQKLLEEKAVAFNKDPPAHWEKTSKCQVPEQKETSEGLKDDICGKCVEAGMAGLCRTHYIEYLGQLIFRHRIDPLPIFDVDELELVLKRANIRLPSRYKLSDRQYQDALIKIIETDVPLERSAGKS